MLCIHDSVLNPMWIQKCNFWGSQIQSKCIFQTEFFLSYIQIHINLFGRKKLTCWFRNRAQKLICLASFEITCVWRWLLKGDLKLTDLNLCWKWDLISQRNFSCNCTWLRKVTIDILCSSLPTWDIKGKLWLSEMNSPIQFPIPKSLGYTSQEWNFFAYIFLLGSYSRSTAEAEMTWPIQLVCLSGRTQYKPSNYCPSLL